MKLHFEPNLDFQLAAIESVCDLFKGQEICRTEFTVTTGYSMKNWHTGISWETELGIGNRLTLLDDEILKNLQEIQLRNGLPIDSELQSGDFTVEMETGTGKTYVYLRTIFELNKRYGFTKFIIVVPSIAIKEGVYKTLQITEDHFRSLYSGVPFEYFVYDSKKLGQVRNFATSPNIQIMVVTVGAINKKDINNLYKDSEKTGGERPIDLIKATRPIIIVDEPQSVDGGLKGKGKQALDAMNPLCTLRYSATHIHKFHMVYRLDAVDAYEKRLVKQVEVASGTIESSYNKPYIRLIEVKSKKNKIFAEVELDVRQRNGVKRKKVKVFSGDDLEQVTKRSLYANYQIGEISLKSDKGFVELRIPGNTIFLAKGEAFGDVDHTALARQMIRRTIKEHLDKEKRLRPKGIKVLSLFFIDRVARYREYDQEGNPVKGIYAKIFEEEYKKFSKHPDYRDLFKNVDLAYEIEKVHNGYFSRDKKKIAGKTIEIFKDTGGESKADENTYNLIMRDKERLLSLKEPLKFIFSHSALREGWDNPNIFQICTLREINTERERRQTIGRGLRLCVDQNGRRVHGFDVNVLTVIATESYEEFAKNLQKEIEEDIGIRFGIVEKHQFAAITERQLDGSTKPIGAEESEKLWNYLKEEGLIDSKGNINDSLRIKLKEGTLPLPDKFEEQRPQIEAILKKLAGRFEVKNADDRRPIRLRKQIYLSPEFKELWDRIKHKTIYRVQFNNEKLIKDCARAIYHAPPIPKTILQWRKADISIGKAGVEAKEKEGASIVVLDENDIELPDILSELQDRTHLTRKSLARILKECGRLSDFIRNPQAFIDLAAKAINRCKCMALVDGIKYIKLGDFYAQELWTHEELTGYLKNMLAVQKGVFDHIIFDSEIEKKFVEDMERNEAVKLYAKLPRWFKIPTPLGSYNSDWAVLINTDEGEKLYFVVETKGSLSIDDLRSIESQKIKCGQAHFEALKKNQDNPARYMVTKDLIDLMTRL